MLGGFEEREELEELVVILSFWETENAPTVLSGGRRLRVPVMTSTQVLSSHLDNGVSTLSCTRGWTCLTPLVSNMRVNH